MIDGARPDRGPRATRLTPTSCPRGCGAAASAPLLLTARALQGVGAAFLGTGALALVAGAFPHQRRRAQAFATIKAICEEHLEGRFELEVVDIYQHPQLAKDEQIIAAPTLVKFLPHPLRRMIGDLSDRERVLLGLDLRRKD